MHAHRIGIDKECAAAVAHRHQAVHLLQPAEQESQEYADDGTYCRYQAAFKEEHGSNLPVGGTHVPQRRHVVFLFYDEHRQRTDDVEARHHKDEGEEDVSQNLLYLHYAERVSLLFVAVEHTVFVAGDALHSVFHGGDVAVGFKSEFQGGKHALLVEEAAGEVDGGDDVVAVVLGLVDGEHHSGRYQRVDHEAVRRVCGIDELSLAARSEDAHIAIPPCPGVKGLCQADAYDPIVKVCSLECELTVAIQYVVDACQLREIVINAHQSDHLLLVAIHCQSLVLNTFRCHRHLGLTAELRQERVIGRGCLPLCGRNLYLGVEVCEQRGHQIVKPVEHTQHDDQSHCAHSHADSGDGGDEVDGVGALL